MPGLSTDESENKFINENVVDMQEYLIIHLNKRKEKQLK